MTAQKFPLLTDEIREISESRQAAFRENGYLFLRELLRPAEAAVFRPLVAEGVRRQRGEKRKVGDRGGNVRAAAPVTNLWRADEGIRQLVLSRRLGRVAAGLLGVSNVRIYHDQAVFSEPGAGATAWHQDRYSQPLDGAATITLWMPLVDLTVDMGMLTIATGSHLQGTVLEEEAANDPGIVYRKYIKDLQLPVTRAAAMRAGDVAWYYGNTVHCAAANETDKVREVMTVIYMAEGARVSRPVNTAQAGDWKAWLRELPPGRLAASELNPLVL